MKKLGHQMKQDQKNYLTNVNVQVRINNLIIKSDKANPSLSQVLELAARRGREILVNDFIFMRIIQ